MLIGILFVLVNRPIRSSVCLSVCEGSQHSEMDTTVYMRGHNTLYAYKSFHVNRYTNHIGSSAYSFSGLIGVSK